MKEKSLKFAKIIFGIIAILLGALWFLQGVGIIQMCPVLCFADCECITGRSLLWGIIGLVVFFIGIASIYKSFRQNRQD